ncbi:sulfatase-like hydrolase/transferase [Mycoplasma sp. Mirounga ES2805-ORL]|uniref:sulfatase-like hydrolase/transferase n=1 Tax=Mycoplasma sp. Mirounga ES2805-ORL TaxID=754514 RepID=UPI00197C1A8A|nr:sulfatase-like hydrolase/transferase [Mycoplasma sp. Mirounga ES2805-ORL]QSF13893.1 sulfatase-like hydrolase/transferase [Mycoplasma sp. Mirounga ES2805-ORL]
MKTVRKLLIPIALVTTMPAIFASCSLNKFRKSTNIFSKNYVDTHKVKIKTPNKKHNLIYITVESLESTVLDEKDGGKLKNGSNIMPELTKLAKENVTFAQGDNLAGPYVFDWSDDTIRGFVSQSSGIPLKDPWKVEEKGKIFFPKVKTTSDILFENGYNNYFIAGHDVDYANHSGYLKSHHYHWYDFKGGSIDDDDLDIHYSTGAGKYYLDNKQLDDSHWGKEEQIDGTWEIPKEYLGRWGYKDPLLFKNAQRILNNLSKESKPFNLQILTVDTHRPHGDSITGKSLNGIDLAKKFPHHTKNMGDKNSVESIKDIDETIDMEESFRYISFLINEFIDWCKQQDWYENTTIVISGDHLSMDEGTKQYYYGTYNKEGYFTKFNKNGKKQENRKVYSTIINPSKELKYDPKRLKNRKFSTLDLFPTTIAALGFEIEGNKLGLGTNLFSGEKSLPEKYGYKYINEEFNKRSHFYNNLCFGQDD